MNDWITIQSYCGSYFLQWHSMIVTDISPFYSLQKCLHTKIHNITIIIIIIIIIIKIDTVSPSVSLTVFPALSSPSITTKYSSFLKKYSQRPFNKLNISLKGSKQISHTHNTPYTATTCYHVLKHVNY